MRRTHSPQLRVGAAQRPRRPRWPWPANRCGHAARRADRVAENVSLVAPRLFRGRLKRAERQLRAACGRVLGWWRLVGRGSAGVVLAAAVVAVRRRRRRTADQDRPGSAWLVRGAVGGGRGRPTRPVGRRLASLRPEPRKRGRPAHPGISDTRPGREPLAVPVAPAVRACGCAAGTG